MTREFLRDITAFANTSGGDLIYGVRERQDAQNKNTGVPESIEGVALDNIDETILRLESIIRDGIAPRLAGCRIKTLDLEGGRRVIVLRVPKSWAAPHMVMFRRSPEFYARSNAGKYPIDVSELRAAFLFSDTLTQRLESFRSERLEKVMSSDAPVPLFEGPKLVLHTIPISGLQGSSPIDPQLYAKLMTSLWPPEENTLTGRYTFDGYLTYGPAWETETNGERHRGYMLAFRNSFLEYATAYIAASEDRKQLWSVAFEEFTIKALRKHLEVLTALGLNLPAFVILSLTGVMGYRLAIPDNILKGHHSDRLAIDRNTLRIPEILVEDFEQNLEGLLKPAFDAVWQAAGFPGPQITTATGNGWETSGNVSEECRAT